MISPYVYWKSATVSLDVPAPVARNVLCQAMANEGFALPDKRDGRDLTFTRPATLPGLPHLQVWTASLDGHGKRTRIRIEFGLRAKLGTWLTFAGATVAAVAPTLVPGFEMAALIPIFWLLGCVLWMQWYPARQEARLWKAVGAEATILDRSTSWRAVE